MRKLAGRLHVDPKDFSLRELAEMEEGRAMEAWDHTTAIQAMILNCRPFKKSGKPISPAQLHPLRRQKKSGLSADEIGRRLTGDG